MGELYVRSQQASGRRFWGGNKPHPILLRSDRRLSRLLRSDSGYFVNPVPPGVALDPDRNG